MNNLIHTSWVSHLESEFEKPYFKQLIEFVHCEYQAQTVYPPAKQMFSAFDHAHFDDVRVMILGQDPYHGAGQANGLCFSVSDGIKIPPSLRNIYKELESDLGVTPNKSGNLEHWAMQGVFLLNATLSVLAGQAGSHQGKGWEEFTDAVIKKLSEEKENLVFILWGAYAQKKGSVIDENKHLVIKSPHPSPFSAHTGFFGSKPFSQSNDYLKQQGKKTIQW
jgi:uracil-DNA glycosylase